MFLVFAESSALLPWMHLISSPVLLNDSIPINVPILSVVKDLLSNVHSFQEIPACRQAGFARLCRALSWGE